MNGTSLFSGIVLASVPGVLLAVGWLFRRRMEGDYLYQQLQEALELSADGRPGLEQRMQTSGVVRDQLQRWRSLRHVT